MKRLCTICARGGSKGVINKNMRSILGKPLIEYTIKQAQKSNIFDVIAVSSDSTKILNHAQKLGVNLLIKRPRELATDFIGKIPVIQHCVKEVEAKLNLVFDIVVDLDVTSPLRKIDDIKAAVELLEERKVTNVITGTPSRRSPYFNMVEIDENGYVKLSKPLHKKITRRQDAPKSYDMNASIYVWNRNSLIKQGAIFNIDTILYEMPEERSIDIDTELDFSLVEFLMGRREDIYGL